MKKNNKNIIFVGTIVAISTFLRLIIKDIYNDSIAIIAVTITLFIFLWWFYFSKSKFH